VWQKAILWKPKGPGRVEHLQKSNRVVVGFIDCDIHETRAAETISKS
jgi:hypothetical protein